MPEGDLHPSVQYCNNRALAGAQSGSKLPHSEGALRAQKVCGIWIILVILNGNFLAFKVKVQNNITNYICV